MTPEENEYFTKMRKEWDESKAQQNRTTTQIIFGLAILGGFYAAYEIMPPHSSGSFFGYILLSIIFSFGFLIPLSFIFSAF